MITVYLDTSDYSIMASQKNADKRIQMVKARLLELSSSGLVRFVFSAVAVGETVPLRKEDVESSYGALKLIRALCGDNCLTTWDNLLKQELGFLCGIRSEPCQPHGKGGIWIPGIKVSHPNVGEAVKLAGEHLNAERRLKETFDNFDWVIENFGTDTDISAHYRKYLRNFGADMARNSRRLVEKLLNSPNSKTRQKWIYDTGVMGLKLAEVYSNEFGFEPADHVSIIDVDDVEKSCPGFSAMNRCHMGLLWTYVGGQAKKEISNSAYIDALHVMYAPYVDIFRADKNMAPHAETAIKASSTRVVRRLLDLPSVIENALTASQ